MITRGDAPERWKVTTSSDLPDGWEMKGRWSYTDGRVRLDDITMVPPSDEATIGGLKAMTRRLGMSWLATEWESVFRSHVLELPHEWQRGFADSPRPGRAGHPPAFYAMWVGRYLDAVAEHDAPVAALVETYPGETNDSINRYLRKAERLELIADRPGRGRAGGVMTERCREILEQGAH